MSEQDCCYTVGLIRRLDGTRHVTYAAPTIRVAADLLTSPDLAPDVLEEDGTLRLDTAGEYRYRFVRAENENVHIYERIQP